MLEDTFLSPAKINLCLHVLGRRKDGYHELGMAMQQVDLCDRVKIRLTESPELQVNCRGVDLGQGEENIAARAARLFLDNIPGIYRVEIEIDKRIPVAAGLGGGSSNAASVLLGLNRLLKGRLNKLQLMELGGQLGADVPFFIFGETAWATGIGTRLQSLPQLPAVSYLLINPKIAVSTTWAYQSLELTRGGELANLPRFSVVSREELCARLYNDLERVTLQRYPLIGEIKQKLIDHGALGSLMSGSGATVFGVFPDFATAQQAGDRIASQHDWLVFPVRPLSSGLKVDSQDGSG